MHTALLYLILLCIFLQIRCQPVDQIPSGIPGLLNMDRHVPKDDEQIQEINTSVRINSKYKRSIPDTEITKFRIENLLEMLNIADKKMANKYEEPKYTVLVMGNPGAGKTTFVQFMAGDNGKLVSKEVGSGTGRYVIEDGNKIGASTIDSSTLYPDLVVDNKNTAFCDTPGFSDTRSPSHEVVATYGIKKFLTTSWNIKIVLMITYHSVEHGVYKDDFLNMLTHFISMIDDIDKYKSSVMLVASKVPNLLSYNGTHYTLISDEIIINNIANYLEDVNKYLKERLTKPENDYQTIFIEKATKLINYLLESDKDGNYKKIDVFRRPNEGGPLSNLTLLQEAKVKLGTKIESNLKYTKSSSTDWKYTLSERAKLFIDSVIRRINEMIIDLTLNIFTSIESHYENLANSYSDIYLLISKLDGEVHKLTRLQKSFNETTTFNEFYTKLVDFIENENISFALLTNDSVSEINQFTEKFKLFTNVDSILSPSTWLVPTRSAEGYLEENLQWYRYLRDLFERLSSYKIQKSVKNFEDTEFTDAADLQGERMKELSNVLSKTVKQRLNVSCDEGILKLEGSHVKLSEINDGNLILNYCGNGSLKSVIIFSFHKVFIDVDLVGKSFASVNVMIVAPIWEVIGLRRIVLSGIEADRFDKEKASDGSAFGEDGLPGKPGLPGDNGGEFLGFGMEFINGAKLVVESRGGDGGPGQSGGLGMKGADGQDGFKYVNLQYNDVRYSPIKKWHNGTTANGTDSSFTMNNCWSEVKVYMDPGNKGGSGGDGGDGGRGGIGGSGGPLSLVELKDDSYITLRSEDGKTGEGGLGGSGGEGGIAGKTVYCVGLDLTAYTTTDHSLKYDFFMNCFPHNDTNINKADSGKPGMANSNNYGMKQPAYRSKYELYIRKSDIESYKVFLNQDSNIFLYNRTLGEFIRLLENNADAKIHTKPT